jgi:hypothetical protein
MREAIMPYLKQNYDDQDHFTCERVVEFRNRLGYRTCGSDQPQPAITSFGSFGWKVFSSLRWFVGGGKRENEMLDNRCADDVAFQSDFKGPITADAENEAKAN